jgi:hypothetical protein
VIHGDFIVGLPGETHETLRRTIDFGKRLDVETIQVSLAHAFPRTEFYEYAKQNALVAIDGMTDGTGHQLPNVIHPGALDGAELMEWVERFYAEYYFPASNGMAHCGESDFQCPGATAAAQRGTGIHGLRAQRSRFIEGQREAQKQCL